MLSQPGRQPGRFPLAGFAYHHINYADGEPGVAEVLRDIADGIRGTGRFTPHSPLVRETAEEILAADSWPPTDSARVQSLYEWVRSRTVYPPIADQRGVEELRGADYSLYRIDTLGRLAADCDCLTILLGALIASVLDVPLRLRPVGFLESEAPDELSHVYLEISTRDAGWVSADLIDDQPFGWEPVGVSRVGEAVPV